MAQIETQAAGTTLLPLVDLNRERREERRDIYRRNRRHTVMILASIALSVIVPLPLTLQVLSLHRQCRKAQDQAAGVGQRLKSVTAAGSEMDAKISRWTQLMQSQQVRHNWSAMLPALAACLPDDVSLQQVQIAQKDDGAQIQLLGTSGSVAMLRAFTESLAVSPYFAHMHLDQTTTGANGVVTFQMEGPVNASLASGTGTS